MYFRPETVLEKYDVKVGEITKGRGVYICDTDKGKKVLMSFRGSQARAEYLCGICDDLTENGFAAEHICRTAEGEAAAEDDTGARFWLKDLTEGSECSTVREAEMCRAAGELAHLHAVAKQILPQAPDILKHERSEPIELYARHGRELIKVKNYINSRHSHNELERLFAEQYPYYIRQANEANDAIRSCAGEKPDTCTLCHGSFHQHQVINTAQGMRIINFETMGWNEPVMDLSNFVRKMMEKNQWDASLGIKMIKSYDSVRSLSGKELKLLCGILLFPEKFWKISNHYCNSHKAWISERDTAKFRKVRESETKRAQFLEKLFLFCAE